MRLITFVLFVLLSSLTCVAAVVAQTVRVQEQQANQPAQAPVSDETPSLAHATRLINEGKYEDAIAELRKLPAEQKGLPRQLGLAYYKQADYLRASVYLEKAMAADSADKEAVQLLGLSYFFTGKPKQAIPLLQQVQSWYPTANVDASYVLGVSYIQVMDFEQARKAFAAMYGVPENSAASHLFVARMLLRQGYDTVAEVEAKKATGLDPKLPLAHYLLGELYIFKSRIPEAIKELEAETALNPGHAPSYYRLADAYVRILKWEDAERLLQRSIWLDATASGPFILMGKVLLKKGESQLALRSLDRALSMDPNNYMGHYLRGQAYRNLGKTADAEREMKVSEQLQAAQDKTKLETVH